MNEDGDARSTAEMIRIWAKQWAPTLALISYLALTLFAVKLGNEHVGDVSAKWMETGGIAPPVDPVSAPKQAVGAHPDANMGSLPDGSASLEPEPDLIEPSHTGAPATDRSELGGSPVRARLFEQRTLALKRRNMNISMGTYFYARHFTSLTLATVFSVLAGTLVLLIAQRGWASSGRLLRASALYAMTAGAFFGVSPALFKQAENSSSALLRATAFDNLANKIDTYLATSCLMDEGSTSAADKEKSTEVVQCKSDSESAVAAAFDTQLSNINSLQIGFDAGAIPKLPEAEFGRR